MKGYGHNSASISMEALESRQLLSVPASAESVVAVGHLPAAAESGPTVASVTVVPRTEVHVDPEFTDVILATIADHDLVPSAAAVTLDWGDASGPQLGTIVAEPNAPGLFRIVGSHTYAPGNLYGNGAKVYAVGITLTMQGRIAGTATASVVVQNVAPTATLSGPTAGFFGQPLTFAIGGSSPYATSMAAGFAYTVDWNDGSAPTQIQAKPGNASGLTTIHIFATSGRHDVRLRVMDGVFASESASLSVQTVPAPVVQNVRINNSAQPEQIGGISFNLYSSLLQQPVSTLTLKNLRLLFNGHHQVPLESAVLHFDPAAQAVNLDLSRTFLPEGDYQLQVIAGFNVVIPIDFYHTGRPSRASSSIAASTAGFRLGHHSLDSKPMALGVVPGSKFSPAPVDFGTVKTGSAVKVKEMVIRNNGSEWINIRGVSISQGGNALDAVVSDGLWKQPAGDFKLAPGQSRTVRIYLTPDSAKTLSAKLAFSYRTASKSDYVRVNVPVHAVIQN